MKENTQKIKSMIYSFVLKKKFIRNKRILIILLMKIGCENSIIKKSYNMNMICHFSFIINDFYAKCKILVKGA